MGMARQVISNELLSQMLFPKGAKILRMQHEQSPVMRAAPDFELIVEHGDLPEVQEGSVVPLASPRYQHTGEFPCDPIELVEWGLSTAASEGQNP